MNTSKFYCPGGMSLKGEIIVEKLHLTNGQKVFKEELVLTLNSGNFEMDITAEIEGVIKLFVDRDQKVSMNDLLFEIEPSSQSLIKS